MGLGLLAGISLRAGMRLDIKMAQNYYWSASKKSFFPVSLLDAYKTAGTLPSDAILVDDDVFSTYSGNPPHGYTRGADSSGSPAWVVIEVVQIPIKDQAQIALNAARAYVQNNFILLGETPTHEWIDYQKALIAITRGTDATATTLPTQPTDIAA